MSSSMNLAIRALSLLGVIVASGCADDPQSPAAPNDGAQTTDAAARDASRGGDALPALDTAPAATDTGSQGGAGFFATFTMDGKQYDVACPAPDADTDPPFLITLYAGNQQNVGCALGQAIGATGVSAAINFKDRRTFQTGAFDETCCGGVVFAAKDVDAPNAKIVQLDSRAANKTSFELSGTYDAAARRITGTFAGTWGPSDDAQLGEGSASGTFDIVLPQ